MQFQRKRAGSHLNQDSNTTQNIGRRRTKTSSAPTQETHSRTFGWHGVFRSQGANNRSAAPPIVTSSLSANLPSGFEVPPPPPFKHRSQADKMSAAPGVATKAGTKRLGAMPKAQRPVVVPKSVEGTTGSKNVTNPPRAGQNALRRKEVPSNAHMNLATVNAWPPKEQFLPSQKHLDNLDSLLEYLQHNYEKTYRKLKMNAQRGRTPNAEDVVYFDPEDRFDAFKGSYEQQQRCMTAYEKYKQVPEALLGMLFDMLKPPDRTQKASAGEPLPPWTDQPRLHLPSIDHLNNLEDLLKALKEDPEHTFNRIRMMMPSKSMTNNSNNKLSFSTEREFADFDETPRDRQMAMQAYDMYRQVPTKNVAALMSLL